MMSSSSPHGPGIRSSIRAILALALQQKRNQLARGRASSKGMRSATAGKEDGKFLMPVFLGLMFAAMSFNFSYQAIHSLAQYAKAHQPSADTPAVLKVDTVDYFFLKGFATSGKEKPAWEGNDRWFIESLMNRHALDEGAAQAQAERLSAHLDEHGLQGFRKKRRASLYQYVDLRSLSAEARDWFGRVIAMVVTCLFVALTLMPLSARSKDLGAVDSQLEWFYCLPLSGREILSGRFVSMVLVRPLNWIMLWPLLSVLFWAMGFGPLGLLLSLGVSLAFSIAATGIELAIETWLRSSASFKLKKNVQSAASLLGALTFYVALGAALSASRSAAWLDWLLDHTPRMLTAIPGRILLLPTAGGTGVLLLVIVLVGVTGLCGVGGWPLAARALSQGFTSGKEREGTRSAGATTATNRSLTKFEWLLLIRDRNLATLVLVVPLMLVFYQFLINPGMLAVTSAQKLAAIGFGCGAWAAIVTAPHVPMSESNSMWMIYSLPVEISAYFRRRARVWRATGVMMAAALIAGLAIWKGGIPSGDWWRIPAALVGVWVVSLASYAVMIGNFKLPDTASGERLRVSPLCIYACMFMAGIVGTTLWHGNPWQVFASLVIWWFFGFGLWQGVSHRLRHLMEPTEELPRQLTIASALFAVIVFFLVQVVVGRGLQALWDEDLAAATLWSYLLAGFGALLFCAIRLSGHRTAKLLPTPRGHLALALPLTMGACIAVGWVWLQLIQLVPPLREIHERAQEMVTMRVDSEDWKTMFLMVVAAPIIEELLFRGYVFRVMQRAWSPKNAIAASALLFAIVHPGLSFPPVFVLGLATAWLYFRWQKLWPGMLLHAGYNAALLVLSAA